nr:probable DNA primase large subunit isoform X2 [Halyomorpha halys]
MAVAILKCVDPSEYFLTKSLVLEENIPQILGKALEIDNVSSDNGLFDVDSPEICHQHAFLIYNNRKFFIGDTSINGTYLNEFKLDKNIKYTVISGDVIQLGSESFSMAGKFKPITFSVKFFTSEEANFFKVISLKKFYGAPLQLYKENPSSECSLSLLHKSIINRFEALKILDEIGNTKFLTEKQIHWILSKFREKGLQDIIKLILGTSNSYLEESNLQSVDHISHFMLSIACCRNYVMKKWFLDQEKKLLFLRWKFLSKPEKHEIISEFFYDLKKVTKHERMEVANRSNGLVVPSGEYYKVFFTNVSELMASRDFSTHLKFNLEIIKKNLNKVWNDERITSIILYVEKEVQFERFLFGRSNSSILLKEIDSLAEQSFPLCMSELHYHLKTKNHLKNGGRFQYGLFLKGIGLSLQDSLTFWRHYFTKKMSFSEFVKYYNYHIFHLYGAIGKKADYPPQSCKKIMEAMPTFSEYHGCPYKISDEENIQFILQRHSLNDEEVKCILNKMKNDTPQLACSKYFEIKHGSSLKEIVFHPNHYYEESRALINLKIRNNQSQLKVSKFPGTSQDICIQSCTAKKRSCSSIDDW